MTFKPLPEADIKASVDLVREYGSATAAAKGDTALAQKLKRHIRAAAQLWPHIVQARQGMAPVIHPWPDAGAKPRYRVKAESVPVDDKVDPLKKGIRDGLPLSEDERKFHEDWTAEDCIEELRRIAEIDTRKVISRNYFRVYSDISESTWNRFFGTFEEFKRQADIILSRHAHRLEKSIAKHASVSKMRVLSEARANYEDKYLRPHSRRFQTLIHVTDLHDKECDPFVLRILEETVQRVQPEKVIIGGDAFDLPEFGKYGVDPREWDVVGRIQAAHAIFRRIRNAAPDAEIVLVEGNHEYRLLRHLAEESPALRVVLSDLHGYTVPKLLGLDEFEINYVARCDLGTFTQRDIAEELNRNFHISWDAYLVHHFPQGEKLGYHGGNGHHHRHWVHQHYSPDRGAYHWTQLGCCHHRLASYTAGEEWGLGFNIAHVDTHRKRVADEYIHIVDHAVVGGRFYERTESEGSTPNSRISA